MPPSRGRNVTNVMNRGTLVVMGSPSSAAYKNLVKGLKSLFGIDSGQAELRNALMVHAFPVSGFSLQAMPVLDLGVRAKQTRRTSNLALLCAVMQGRQPMVSTES